MPLHDPASPSATSAKGEINHFEDLESGSRLAKLRSHDPDGDLGHEGRPSLRRKGFYETIGNPGVLGLAAHAVTLMLVSTQFMQWRGVSNPQVYVGNLFFYSGLYMFTTCQWTLIKGETFASTVFGTFSGFYLSYAAILTPAFNVATTYANDATTELESLATFLFVWNGVFTVIFLVSLRTNVALAIVFFGVSVGVFLLAAMYVQLGKGNTSFALSLSKAGGAFLFLSACSGFWLTLGGMMEAVDMPWTLPVGDLTRFWPKKRNAS